MSFPVTLNGRTYTLADFEGTNYVDGFPDALEDFVTQAGDIYNTTSTSSVAIGTGSKSFTTADSGKPYQAGTPLRIADAADPETNFMDCIVTSYSGTSLVVDAFGFAGSGTISSWTINIGGAKTVDGTLAVNQGGTGATTASAARTNLGLGSIATQDADSVNIDGGSIDGVTIGGASAGAGTFTTLQADTSLNVDGTVTADGLTVDGAISQSVTAGTVPIDIDTNISSSEGSVDIIKAKTVNDEYSTITLDRLGSTQTGLTFKTTNTGTLAQRLKISNEGDISFYEDTGTTPKLFWDASAESLGIGTTSPLAKFQTKVATDFNIAFNTAGGIARISCFDDVASASSSLIINGADLRFTTETAERMRIDSSGLLLVGASSTDGDVHKTPKGIYCQGNGTGGNTSVAAFVDADGAVGNNTIIECTFINDNSFAAQANYILFGDNASIEGEIRGGGNGSVTYDTSSDRRLKENIRTTDDVLDRLMQVEVRDYERIKSGTTETGFIAQELHEHFSGLHVKVGGDDEQSDPWTMDYGRITPYLWKAIQEQQAIIESLTARIETLEGN